MPRLPPAFRVGFGQAARFILGPSLVDQHLLLCRPFSHSGMFGLTALMVRVDPERATPRDQEQNSRDEWPKPPPVHCSVLVGRRWHCPKASSFGDGEGADQLRDVLVAHLPEWLE
jgi:hypothetical protein